MTPDPTNAAAAKATSGSFTPTEVGTWCFDAEYSGDGNYAPSSDGSSTECFTVTAASSNTSTTPIDPTITLGGSNTDKATITGNATGGTPTGTVSFLICGPLTPASTCAIGGTAVGGAVTLTSGTATSAAFTPDALGTWCFRAEYAGDVNYTPSSDGSSAECFTVTPANAGTTSAPISSTVTIGASNTDQATVTGNATGGPPGGTVSFFACGPLTTASGCSSGSPVGAPVTVAASGNTATATSAAFTASAVGTWCFRAEYSGDGSYTPSSDGTSAECFTVTADRAGATSTPSAPTVTIGASNTDQATVSGDAINGPPTGMVGFWVCGPLLGASGCSSGGNAVGTPVTLAAAAGSNATATSPAFAATRVGTWCFRAEYSGDGSYAPSSDASSAECFTVTAASSTTSTTPGSPTRTLGESNTDQAAVSGNGTNGIPAGSVSFFVCGPLTSAFGCGTGGNAVGGAVTLSGGLATSPPFTATGVGTWCFRADYSGDANYAPSSDGSSTECFTVTAATSDTASTPSSSTLVLGATNTDQATVTDGIGGPTPTGTVSFSVCGPFTAAPNVSGCSTGGGPVGSAVTVSGGAAASAAFTPGAAGTWCFRAEYSGDANYTPSSDGSSTECFTVTAAPGGTSSTPAHPTVALGASNTDTATVTGLSNGPAPTGTVNFSACGPLPNASGCPSGGTAVGGTVALINGTATSSSFTATGLGTWCFRAEYSGDANYTASADGSGAECFTVTAASSTTVSTPTSQTLILGGSNTDNATVTGNPTGSNPTANVSFSVCGPLASASGCATGGTAVASTVPLTAGMGDTATATSPSFTPGAAGTWCFRAEYSGDTNYSPSADSSTTECFTVTAATSTTKTTPTSQTLILGGSNTDTATVTGNAGGPGPTGTVNFFVCGPFATALGCASGGGNPVGSGVTLSGGTATSASFTPGGAGMWCFRAEYSGDANYAASSDGSSTECFTVTAASSSTASIPGSSTIAFGGSSTDKATVTGNAGGPTPAGTVNFFACGPFTTALGCASGGGNPVGGAVTLSGGIATSASFTPGGVGTWCFRAEYSGDANYTASADGNSTECFTVTPASSTTKTTPAATTVGVGAPNTDKATVTGITNGPIPTGTVKFFVCGAFTSADGCASGGITVGGTVTLTGGAATSAAFTATGLGTWCFRAEYSGDANYTASSDGSSTECFTVTAASPPTASTPTSPTITLGGSNSDNVTVGGNATGGNPTGTVDFWVCGPLPSASGCATGGTAVASTVPLTPGVGDTATATSPSFTPGGAGTWCFRAAYSGDTNYAPSSDGSSKECFTVTAATSTTASTPSSQTLILGSPNTDQATVTGNPGGPVPAGTVNFFVCGPFTTALGCASGAGSPVGSSATLSGGAATSSSFTANGVGTWCFRAEYSGEANYTASSDGSSTECFTVTAAISTTASTPTSRTLIMGGSNTDTVTVTGVTNGPIPAGTVNFFVCGPSATALGCASGGGSPVGSAVTLSGGTATSASFTPNAAGTWCFRAEYSGDANYAASADGSTTECFTVSAASSKTASNPTLATVAFGGSNTDKVTVTSNGGPTPTGTVNFFVCGPFATALGCASGGGSPVGSAVTLSGGTATSPSFTAPGTGTWCFRAEYSGDANYAASADGSSTECFTVTAASSTTKTTPTASTVVLGVSNTDKVTVAGNGGSAPTGSVNFLVCGPFTTALGCASGSGSPVGGAVTLSGGTATSASFTAGRAGTWCFRAEYAGDANDTASADGSSTECFTVTAASSKTASSATPSTIAFGGSSTDKATVTGNAGGPTPTGTVNFFVCGPTTSSGCASGGGSPVGSAVTLSGGTATSAAFTPGGAGTWCFRAEYSGDPNYTASADGSSTECFTVTAASSPMKTTPTAATVILGVSNTDKATVTGNAGGPAPTGTVTFFVCGPFPTALGCASGGGSPVGSAVTLSGGTATSASFTAGRTGTWCFRAEYSGDTNYAASADGSTTECFTVTQASSTTASAPSALTITLGNSNTDKATVTGNAGGPAPTGTVSFFACGPFTTASGCATTGGNPVGSGAVTLSGGMATSAAFTPGAGGTWCFRAVYSGDTNYTASADGSSTECFTAGQATSMTSSTPTFSTVTLGGANSDKATVSSNPVGGITPTGTVSFFICGPFTTSSGCATAGSPVGSTGLIGGVATSPSYTPNATGTWCFRAAYLGDTNYSASFDGSSTECFTVTAASSTTKTTPTTSSITLGSTNTDKATVAGVSGVTPTGKVTFFACGPLPGASGCTAGTQVGSAVTVTAGIATSAAFLPTGAGTWCFRAAYSGDSNYSASSDGSTTECFTVAKASPGTTSTPASSTIALGASNTDHTTVTGNAAGGSPTSTVSFFVCGPLASASGCASGTAVGTPVTVAAAAGNAATATSPSLTPAAVGTWCFRAVYSGDTNYSSSFDSSSAECFTVTAASSTTTSTLTSKSISMGASNGDKATVTGNTAGGKPTGTVSFFACGPLPSASGCSSGTGFGSAVTVVSKSSTTAAAKSAAFTPKAVGTWCLRALYSGDAHYASSSDGTTNRCFTVTAVVNDLVASGVPVTAKEGTSGTVSVATFTDPSTEPASSFSATITWGDGGTSPGTISGSGPTYTVGGTHNYADEGSFKVAVAIIETDGAVPAPNANATSTATVAEGDVLTPSARTITAVHGAPSTQVVAGFDDVISNVPKDFTAVINWGDGTSTSPGTEGGSGTAFTVTGTHTYATAGTFTITVIIADVSSTAKTTVTSTAHVS